LGSRCATPSTALALATLRRLTLSISAAASCETAQICAVLVGRPSGRFASLAAIIDRWLSLLARHRIGEELKAAPVNRGAATRRAVSDASGPTLAEQVGSQDRGMRLACRVRRLIATLPQM